MARYIIYGTDEWKEDTIRDDMDVMGRALNFLCNHPSTAKTFDSAEILKESIERIEKTVQMKNVT